MFDILFCISISIFLLYNVISIILFDIPKSLSETFYLYGKFGKIVFPLAMVGIAFPLMVFGLEITPSPYKGFAFTCPASLILVGVAAMFKESFVRNVHFAAAGICAALAFCWIGFVYPKGFYCTAIITPIFLLCGWFMKGHTTDGETKHSITYWAEMVAFVSLYYSMYAYYLTLS